MNVFKNIFNWVYKRQRTRFGKTESAIVGVLALSILIWINIKSFIMLFYYFEFIPNVLDSNFEAALSGSLVMLCVGVYIFTTKYHLKIESQSSIKNLKGQQIKNTFLISYILLTFVFFLLMVRLIHA